jgi:alpha-tubulin suppressor-like RCC1 family protein
MGTMTSTLLPTVTNTATTTPTAIGVLAIDASMIGTCALTTNHGVKCWGNNSSGQLGDGSTNDSNVPVDVRGLDHGIQSIAMGDFHACAMTTENLLKCWGLNNFGELGDGSTTDSPFPLEISVFQGSIRSMALGSAHTCGLTNVAVVKCWGTNYFGQLGDGTGRDSLLPVEVVGLTGNITVISSAYFSTCALNDQGAVKCWGDNEFGELGDGSTTNRNSPVYVAGLTSGVAAISLGDDHGCALMASGKVKCWGKNQAGQLGDGTVQDRLTPVDVVGLDGVVVAVEAGSLVTCARMSDGRVECWGSATEGAMGYAKQCQSNSFCSQPVEIAGLSNDVVSLAVGGTHVCVLLQSGRLKCWGDNSHGQVGNGTNDNQFEPVDVIGL